MFIEHLLELVGGRAGEDSFLNDHHWERHRPSFIASTNS